MEGGSGRWERSLRGGAAAHRYPLRRTDSIGGSLLFLALTLYHLLSSIPVSFQEETEEKCLFWSPCSDPSPCGAPPGDGAPTRSLVQGGWGSSQGVCMETGSLWGVREGAGDTGRPLTASFRAGPWGEVSSPGSAGDGARAPEEEAEGENGGAGATLSSHNQPEPQEQRRPGSSPQKFSTGTGTC